MNKSLLYSLLILACFSCSKSQEPDNAEPSEPEETAKQLIVFTADCCSKIIEGYSPTGTKLWRKTLSFNSGLSPRAAYLNGKVYFSYGSGIYAWDSKTGNQVWYSQNQGVCSAPVAANNTIYATNNLGEVMEINPETGVLNRTSATISQLVPYPPFYHDSTLYVVSATNLAVYSVHAYDLRTRRVKWSSQVGINPTNNMVVVEGKLCLISGTGQLVALNLASGTEAWKRSDAAFKLFTHDKNTIYALAETTPEKVFAIDAATGAQKWVWDPGWSAPLPRLKSGYVFEKTLLVEAFRLNTRVIYTFDLTNGQLLQSENSAGGALNHYFDLHLVGKKLYRFSTRNTGAQYNQVMIFDAKTHTAVDSFRISDDQYNVMSVIK